MPKQRLGTLLLKPFLLTKENAKAMNVSLEVVEQDALNAPCDNEKWDIVVSNPPYITPKEQSEMEANVLQFEPRLRPCLCLKTTAHLL